MTRKTTGKTSNPKFDPAAAITNDLIKIIERGTLPWRQPWKGGAAPVPLRHCGTPYKGTNAFLLTIQQMLSGYTSPYWMTMLQANEQDARIRKGEKSSLVVRYGTYESREDAEIDVDDNAHEDGRRTRKFLKCYRVFNACQIDGLDDRYFPEQNDAPAYPSAEPIPHMQQFFDAIDITTIFTGRQAYYMPAVDRVYMPEMVHFNTAHDFYSTWSHELAHATKAPHRLNRDYGKSRFGNAPYSREEITAELTAWMLGQHLGFALHTIENTAAYIQHWVTVLRSDKNAIFKHAGDAQKACDYLIARSEEGRVPAPIAA